MEKRYTGGVLPEQLVLDAWARVLHSTDRAEFDEVRRNERKGYKEE